MNTLRSAILTARLRDQHIAVAVKSGQFTILRSIPRKGRSHDQTVLAGPMAGWQCVESLQRFATGGSL